MSESADDLLAWLLSGDVSLQYQVKRDLLGEDDRALQRRIATEGWGQRFLEVRRPDGHWGRGFYQPKWISTHYTLLDLKHLALPPHNSAAQASAILVARNHKGVDGGINPSVTIPQSDVCVNGMFLNYGCYFGVPAAELQSVIDFIIGQQLADGGFNCHFNRQGARHSSLHSTISILEGIQEYVVNGYTYRLSELLAIAAAAREFILVHRFFLSDRTGQIINKRFLLLSYPSRWFYDILRALVHFQSAGTSYDPRMQPTLDVLAKKRRKDGRWPVQARHPGQTHFKMEKTGGPSRWNSLRALKVLRHFAG